MRSFLSGERFFRGNAQKASGDAVDYLRSRIVGFSRCASRKEESYTRSYRVLGQRTTGCMKRNKNNMKKEKKEKKRKDLLIEEEGSEIVRKEKSEEGLGKENLK